MKETFELLRSSKGTQLEWWVTREAKENEYGLRTEHQGSRKAVNMQLGKKTTNIQS